MSICYTYYKHEQLLTTTMVCMCVGGPVQDMADVQHTGAGILLQLQQHSEAAAGGHHLPLCGAPL